MPYNSVGAIVNDNNLEVWEAELQRWHVTLDLIEVALSEAKGLYSGKNLADELEVAFTTANRLAGGVSLKVDRIRRSQTNDES